MVQYTVLQYPELLFSVQGRDSRKSRYKATKKILDAINKGKLKTALPEGFCTTQLVEMTNKDFISEGEQEIVQAIKTISKLAAAKRTTAKLVNRALYAREKVNVLFTDEFIYTEEIEQIEKGLKNLRAFAQARLRQKEALEEAEKSREIIDKALALLEEEKT